jgi:hypothetical protein
LPRESKDGSGEEIAKLAARLRGRHALGRSDGLNRLFDYLAECAVAGARPKEFEVAVAVFGRSSAFDGSQDASVRVAVHRLRRKLDDFYSDAGRDEAVRLQIPKGEYRMVAEPRPREAVAIAPARPWARIAAAAIAVLAVLNIAAWAVFWATHGTERTLAQVQASAPWAPLLKAEPPTLLVIGDYYIFGEIDERAGINRLVREYGINSREDLDAWLMDNPKVMGSYRDLDLYYLPVGAAFALRSIVPIISRGSAHSEALHVVMASDLTPEMLKRNNIVYLGYLSGLGVLRAPVFAGSRFSFGETYDELIDSQSHKTYVSQEGGPSPGYGNGGDASRRDYGYVTAFKGPAGNRIMVIAGDRDTGLMEAAEALANPETLKALAKSAGGGDGFEALYEAQGIGRSSLGGRLLIAAPRRHVNPWTEQTNQTFPAG